MNSVQIQCFLAVARTLNFTEAAAELYLTQQAVSKYIINLEKDLGVTLFTREYGKTVLTDSGVYYQNMFTNFVWSYERTKSEVKNLYGRLEQNFAIGYSNWLDPFGEIDRGFSAFKERHKGTVFSGRHYDNTRLMNELKAGHLDVILISERQMAKGRDYEAVPIARERLSLYVPEASAGECLDKKCWGLSMFLCPSRNWSEMEMRQIGRKEVSSLGLDPDEIVMLPNVSTLFMELAMGSGVTVCDAIFGLARTYGELMSFDLHVESYLYCVWKSQNDNPLIPDFVRQMRSTYGLPRYVPSEKTFS
jgi:DNA-binding transcriptional LysR family regulator